MTNLYDSRIYFEIIFNGVATQIIEPDKWNTIQSHIPRDPVFFGFWSDFLDDRYGMRFSYIKTYEPASGLTITGGGELIWSIYNQYGSEAELYFSFGQYNKNVKQEVNRWRINLNTIDDSDFGGVMVDIEKMPFQAKLRARMSAPVTINEYSNMDGGLLTPIPNSNVRLHSKVLPEQTIAISNSPQLTNEYYGNAGLSGFNPLLLALDFSNIVTAELQNVPSAPCALINDGTITSTIAPSPEYVDVVGSRLFQYSALTSGNLKIICNTTFTYWHWHAGSYFAPAPGGEENPWICEYQLKQYRNVNGVYTQIGSTIFSTPFILDSDSPNFHFGDIGVAYIFPDMTDPADRSNTNKIENINLAWEQDGISVNAGDDFYLYIVFSSPDPYVTGDSIIRQQISNLTNNISFYQDTTYPPSISPAYRIFDVLNQQIEAITGQANALISPFFSYGGFGYNYLVTNGYSIRNFGNLIYKPKKDLASFLNDLQSIFFIGVGIKKINGVEYLYVDYCPSLFQEKTIGTYQTLEWKDSHSKEFCYNKAELGYKKYSALNLIQEDEFCTQGSYLLQFLKTQDNTLTKQSDTIAAGYLLEEQRRNQYLYNQQQSLTNDSDLFIIATSEPCIFNIPYTTLPFGTGAYIQFGFNAGLFPGDTVSILNSPNTPQYFNLTIYRQVQGYPKYISGVLTDQYEVVANGIWSSGTTYNPSNIVADPSDGYTLWICLSTVSSSLYPSSDLSHWFPFLGLYPLTSRVIGTNFVSQVQITPLSPDQVFAERFQPFEICNGVVDPSSIYNGRLSLKHILYNWRPLLGVGLEWVNIFSPDYSVSQIIPTLVRMNALFTSQFWDSEPNKGNIGDIITVEIQREFLSKYLSNGKNLFMPQGLTCKIKIGYDDYNLIRMALTGETNNPDLDFGGLVLQDWQGIWWFCHIIDFKYNFVEQIAEIKAQKVRQVSIPIS